MISYRLESCPSISQNELSRCAIYKLGFDNTKLPEHVLLFGSMERKTIKKLIELENFLEFYLFNV